MASIEGRRVRWYDPASGRRKTKTLSGVKEAKRFAERCEDEARLYSDGYLDADQLRKAQVRVVPIAKVIELFGQDFDRRQVTPQHKYNIMWALDRAVSLAGVQNVRDLTAQRLGAFLRRLVAQKLSARAHNLYRDSLADFCRWLVAYDYLKRNPMTAIKRMDEKKDPRRPSRALTVAEADALTEAAPSATRKTLYRFRLQTGLRCREASRVRWSDIDLKSRTLRLRAEVTKNGKPDVLPLADDVCDALASLQQDALKAGSPPQPHHSVFGPPPDPRTWRRDLDRAGVKDKLPEGQADPKCLRKTFGSFLLRAEVDPIDVLLLMRHRPPAGLDLTLGTYGDEKALLKRKRRAIARMVGWIDKQRKKAKAASG